MYKWIIAAFIIVPALELWGILQVGDWLGGWTTFWVIVLLGVAGAYFAQLEGRKVWLQVQRQLQAGQPPGRAMLDGLCVLAGGLLLLIPGFFTDIVGIVLLMPFTRPFFRQMLLNWLEKRMKNGQFNIRRY